MSSHNYLLYLYANDCKKPTVMALMARLDRYSLKCRGNRKGRLHCLIIRKNVNSVYEFSVLSGNPWNNPRIYNYKNRHCYYPQYF